MTTAVKNKSMIPDSPGVNLIPPAVFFSFLICGGLLEIIFPQHFPVLSVPVRLAIGIIISGGGFLFMIVAHETFKRIGTAVPTNEAATVFVSNGPYRFSRNPMYVGGSAFFLGIGLMAGSLWILLLWVPLAGYLALYVIPREEAYLARTFGNDYRKYQDRVRRWF